jgi:hypothetical protein
LIVLSLGIGWIHGRKEFNVEDYRVVYIGKEKDEKRTYVAASAEVVQMFLDKNDIEKGEAFG